MQKTENYGLNKPESTDKYSVEDFNENMEILDAKLAECFRRGNEFKENLVSNLVALGFDVDASQSIDELFSKLETVKKGSGTAQPQHVLKGQTFTNDDGVEYEGTMEDMSGVTVATASVAQDDSKTYLTIPQAGYYDEKSKLCTENSNLGSEFVVANENVDIGSASATSSTKFHSKTYNADLVLEKDTLIVINLKGQSYGGSITSVKANGEELTLIKTINGANSGCSNHLYNCPKGNISLTVDFQLQTSSNTPAVAWLYTIS